MADGHWGESGARIAIQQVAEFARTWVEDRSVREPSLWQDALIDAVQAAHRALVAAAEGKRGPRTTLSLALARRPEGAFFSACVGDSHLFWIDRERCLDLGWPRDQPARFLGQRDVDAAWVRQATRIETGTLRDTRALLAATDGLSEPGIGVDDPPLAVLEALEESSPYPQAERAAVAAHRLATTTCETHARNGAGDNIAIAVAWCQDDS